MFGKPKVHLHGPEFNLTSVAVKAEISLYPQIMFGIDLEAARTVSTRIGVSLPQLTSLLVHQRRYRYQDR